MTIMVLGMGLEGEGRAYIFGDIMNVLGFVIPAVLFIMIAIFLSILYLVLNKSDIYDTFMKKTKKGLILMLIGAWLWAIGFLVFTYAILSNVGKKYSNNELDQMLENLEMGILIVGIATIILIFIATIILIPGIKNRERT